MLIEGGDHMKGDNDKRREEFVNAAEELFKKNGIVDTTVNAIVKQMDVAKGLFYYYFNSKDDVVDAISEKYNKTFRQTISSAVHSSDDYEKRLREFLDGTVHSFRTLWENLNGENENIDLSILSSRTLEEAKTTAREALHKLLQEGDDLGKLNIKDPDAIAQVIISGIADLAKQAEMDGRRIRELMEDLIRRSGKEN